MTKVALIGCGRWGKHYLKTFTSLEECQLTWVLDIDREKLKEAAVSYPQIKYTVNKEDILNDPTVEGVVIATTPESHYRLAKEFMAKGKAVLVEKPVSIKRQGSMDLIASAAKQQTILMAGYIMIYHPAVQRIKEFLLEANGHADKLSHINMSRTNSADLAKGVDVLHDLAVHDIYLSRFFMGEDPIWVSAHGGKKYIYILLGFSEGKVVSIFASSIHTEKTRQITLVTEKTKLVFDDLQRLEKKIKLFTNNENHQTLMIKENIEPLQCECQHFLECIRENKEPKTGRDYIISVAKITDDISTSLKRGGEKVIIRSEHNDNKSL